MPAGAVYVGRPTIWGNPFRPGDELAFPYADVHGPVVLDRPHAVEVFASHARTTSGYAMLARLRLADRDLCCWCPLDQPCHADILMELANG